MGSYGNKGLLPIAQSSRSVTSPSVAVLCYDLDICSFWPINETLTGTINQFQSGMGSNGIEGVLHIPQNSKSGASPSVAVLCYDLDICSFWPINETLTGTINQFQSGMGSNGIEGVLHIPQNSKSGASPSVAVLCYDLDICSFWPINETLTGTINQFQSGMGSNGIEGVLHILQSSWSVTSPSNIV